MLSASYPNSHPGFIFVGPANKAVEKAKDRLRAAFSSCDITQEKQNAI